ncbi:MAG: hypothetical protein ACK4J0_01880 [Candidatus Anstonellaceae archaeon]
MENIIKNFVIFLFFVSLVVFAIEGDHSYNNTVASVRYTWKDGVTVPLECIEKCKDSRYNTLIVISPNSTNIILSEECKNICFNTKTIQPEPQSTVERKTPPSVLSTTTGLEKKEVEERNEKLKEIKEEFKERIKERVEGQQEKNAQNKSNDSAAPTAAIVQERNEKLKEIKEEFKERIKERVEGLEGQPEVEVEIRNKPIKIKIKPNQTEKETEIQDGKFKLLLKNVSLVNNSLLVNNKTIILPSEIESNLTKARQNIKQLKIIQNNNQIKYQIKAAKKAKILGFFPVEYEEDIEVDGTNGKQNVVSAPWWKIFTFD